MMVLSDTVKRDIVRHAREEYPNEACGLIVFSDGVQQYLPCENIAAMPSENFEIDARDWMNAADAGEIAAVVHSHPDGQPFLSGADRQIHAQSSVPWILAAGSPHGGFALHVYRPCAHLRGRVFEYGTNDCGTLVRDALMLCGLEFADYPRGTIDDDIARGIWPDCLAKRGFAQLPSDTDLQAGDVVLTRHKGRPAHAALYLGNGEILHHPLDGLSRREPYYGYWQDNTHSVWRHPRFRPEMTAGVLNDLAHSAT